VALNMVVDQLPELTGVDTTGGEFFPQLWFFAAQLADAHTPTVLLSAVVLVFLFTVPKYVPGPLLAFVLATATVIVFDLDDRYSVKVIGEIPSGLRAFAWPDLSELPRLVLPALGVLIVAYTDFILTARGRPARLPCQQQWRCRRPGRPASVPPETVRRPSPTPRGYGRWHRSGTTRRLRTACSWPG
jgi:sulfate permease, SulP family